MPITAIRPTLVGKLNERQVFRLVRTDGPLTRADLVRASGLSAPTVSKAVASLQRAGLLEEADAGEPGRGRPAPRVRLATATAQVIGVAVDAGQCDVVSAGLDGVIHPAADAVPTPRTYDVLLDVLEAKARRLMDKAGVATLGVGVSLPGLVDHRDGRGVLSPNVPMTDGRTPAADLGARLGVPAVLVQESHALCLAERHDGPAKGLDDFAVLDVGTGVGLGVVLDGRPLTGAAGLAGEIGHVTAVADGGPACGCGNRGCLEAVLHRAVQAGDLPAVAGYMAVAAAAVINLFNPATLFLHSRLFDADPTLFDRVLKRTAQRALRPSLADCVIRRAAGSKRQGAVAAAVGLCEQQI